MHTRLPAASFLFSTVLVLTLVAGFTGVRVETRGLASQDDRATVWDGVYTAAQAARGKAVYETSCSACHLSDLTGSSEARPLAGEPFMQDWREDNLDSLFTRIRSLMPFDDPATLSNDAYLDSVAYILEFNGFPAGNRELTTDGLEDIQIEGREGPGAVPSFALVQAIGCLTQGPDNNWLLTHSTAAVRTRNPSGSTADELQVFETQPLGTLTFTLMSVYPSPDAHNGYKVEAKGFLIRLPDENRINVSSLGIIAPGCEP